MITELQESYSTVFREQTKQSNKNQVNFSNIEHRISNVEKEIGSVKEMINEQTELLKKVLSEEGSNKSTS